MGRDSSRCIVGGVGHECGGCKVARRGGGAQFEVYSGWGLGWGAIRVCVK